eukprot:CAMPEP_0206487352 /NCGR_PEP_ID=MMETSP0324_2-20121206/41582_1 /ASSEMBLY_ACC=CAM_ASM_000836 /TAXON_ID=2866 /ORGANISM="Crypthecodinium cohnii, Strain Seligo" /LENGTH=948 /DNA_ID=CAMNT_0053965801 /DNA_START=229 /DNA_END=3076 /DNA_ORIENTATION=-
MTTTLVRTATATATNADSVIEFILHLHSGGGQRYSFDLAKESSITLGRARTSDIVLTNTNCSSTHVELRYEADPSTDGQGKLIAVDKSSNGTGLKVGKQTTAPLPKNEACSIPLDQGKLQLVLPMKVKSTQGQGQGQVREVFSLRLERREVRKPKPTPPPPVFKAKQEVPSPSSPSPDQLLDEAFIKAAEINGTPTRTGPRRAASPPAAAAAAAVEEEEEEEDEEEDLEGLEGLDNTEEMVDFLSKVAWDAFMKESGPENDHKKAVQMAVMQLQRMTDAQNAELRSQGKLPQMSSPSAPEAKAPSIQFQAQHEHMERPPIPASPQRVSAPPPAPPPALNMLALQTQSSDNASLPQPKQTSAAATDIHSKSFFKASARPPAPIGMAGLAGLAGFLSKAGAPGNPMFSTGPLGLNGPMAPPPLGAPPPLPPMANMMNGMLNQWSNMMRPQGMPSMGQFQQMQPPQMLGQMKQMQQAHPMQSQLPGWKLDALTELDGICTRYRVDAPLKDSLVKGLGKVDGHPEKTLRKLRIALEEARSPIQELKRIAEHLTTSGSFPGDGPSVADLAKGLGPEQVQEIDDWMKKHDFDDRIRRRLIEIVAKDKDRLSDYLRTLDDNLKSARNPRGFCNALLGRIQEGSLFVEKLNLNKEQVKAIADLCDKYEMDRMVKQRLERTLSKRNGQHDFDADFKVIQERVSEARNPASTIQRFCADMEDSMGQNDRSDWKADGKPAEGGGGGGSSWSRGGWSGGGWSGGGGDGEGDAGGRDKGDNWTQKDWGRGGDHHHHHRHHRDRDHGRDHGRARARDRSRERSYERRRGHGGGYGQGEKSTQDWSDNQAQGQGQGQGAPSGWGGGGSLEAPPGEWRDPNFGGLPPPPPPANPGSGRNEAEVGDDMLMVDAGARAEAAGAAAVAADAAVVAAAAAEAAERDADEEEFLGTCSADGGTTIEASS